MVDGPGAAPPGTGYAAVMSDVRDDDGPDPTPGPGAPISVPGSTEAEADQQQRAPEPQSEADRQAADTVRAISRLEEAN